MASSNHKKASSSVVSRYLDPSDVTGYAQRRVWKKVVGGGGDENDEEDDDEDVVVVAVRKLPMRNG
jgi:hypothetical protein